MRKQRKKFLFFLFFLFFCTQSKWKKKLSRSQCAVIAPQDQLHPVKSQGVLRWHSPGINKCCIGNLDAYLWLYLA